MNPAALLLLVALGWFVVQTSAQQRRTRRGPARNPHNPRRRARRPGAGQLELPEAPAAYPVYHVAGGGDLPGRKKQPYWVFAQWAGVGSGDLRWFSHDPVGRSFSSYAAAADVARELAKREGGVFEPSRDQRRRLLNRNPRRARRPRRNPITSPFIRRTVQTSAQPRRCGCGSGGPCLENPAGYQASCRIGTGHVFDFRHGGRCQCCGRMAPKRLVTLEWDQGGETSYGSTCAGRAIGTTKLRTNQLEHMARQEAEREEHERVYRGVARGRMAESGVERPPYAWARGLSLAALAQIARDAGVSPYTYGWWDSANLVPGGREMQLRQGVGVQVRRRRSGEYVGAVLEGGHRSDQRRSSRTTATPSRGRGRASSSRRGYTPPADLPF